MFTKATLAIALAAAAASTLAQPAAARDTGPYGDWRSQCGRSMMSIPSSLAGQQRPLTSGTMRGTLYWDKHAGISHPARPGWHFVRDRCLWFGVG